MRFYFACHLISPLIQKFDRSFVRLERVNIAAAQIDDRLKLNVLLSSTPSAAQISKPKGADFDVSTLNNVTSSLVKAISTANMAFTFGFKDELAMSPSGVTTWGELF